MKYFQKNIHMIKLAVCLVIVLLVTSILPSFGTVSYAAAKLTLEKKYKYSYVGTSNTYKMLNLKVGYTIQWSISDESKGNVSFSKTDKNKMKETVKVTGSTSQIKVYTHRTTNKKIGTAYKITATVKDANDKKLETITDRVIISCDAVRVNILNEPVDDTMYTGSTFDFNRLINPTSSSNKTFWQISDENNQVIASTKTGVTSGKASITSKGIFKPIVAGSYTITALAYRSKSDDVIRAQSPSITIKAVPAADAAPTVTPTVTPAAIAVNNPSSSGSASPTTAPEQINLSVNAITPGVAYRVNTDTITITGSAISTTSVKELKVTYHSNANSSVRTFGITGTNPFTISSLPLDIGNNYVTITAVAANQTAITKELIISRASTMITLADNVISFDPTTPEGLYEIRSFYEGIENYWKDDMGTPDNTNDDEYNLIVRSSSILLEFIQDGLYQAGDIIYVPQCEYFPSGLALIYRNNDDTYPTDMIYDDRSYQVIHTQIPGFGDLFADNISIHTTEINPIDPIAFVLLPDGTEMYLADDNGNNHQLLSSSEDLTQREDEYAIQPFALENSSSVSGKGFQLNNLSSLLTPTIDFSDITNGSIVLDFDDAILYDKDGDMNGETPSETDTDRVTVSGEVSLRNIHPTFGLDWSPSVTDLLPQQFMSKLEYTQTMDLNCAIGSDLGTLSELLSNYKVKTNAFANKRSFVGIDVEGVNMDNTIILGAIGINLTGVQGANVKTLQAASIIAPFNPTVVILICLNADGQLTTKLVFDYQTSIYREQGINIQKEGYIGNYGSSEQNTGTANFLVGDKNVNIYNVSAKSKNERNALPESTLSITANGTADASVSLGAAVGFMMAGIVPASVKADIGPSARADMNGTLTITSGGAITVDAINSLSLKLSLKAAASCNLVAKRGSESTGITFNKDLGEFVLLNYNLGAGSFAGNVYASDFDRDLTNNPVLSDALVSLTEVSPSSLELTNHFEVRSGSDGSFAFDNIPTGIYTLAVTKDGYVALQIDVSIGTVLSNMNVYLDTANQTAALSGIVTLADEDTDANNNSPLSGINVLLNKIGSTTTPAMVVITDASGYYSFENLPLGIYQITISDSNFIPITSEIIIRTANTTNYNITLEAISNSYLGTGTASGTVYNALSGNGADAGLTLTVYRGYGLSTGEVVTTSTTGENGVYSLSLAAGNYTVYVKDNRTDAVTKYLDGYFNIKVLGNISISNQNGYITPILSTGEVRIVLSWGATPDDLDSHLNGPTSTGGTFHTYFGSETYTEAPNTIVMLDVDDTDSYGPETTTIYYQQNGVYKFTVHDYSNRGSSNSTELANSGAIVKVYVGSSELIYYVPRVEGNTWDVFEYNSETGVFNALNNMYYHENASTVGSQISLRSSFAVEPATEEPLKDYELEEIQEK